MGKRKKIWAFFKWTFRILLLIPVLAFVLLQFRFSQDFIINKAQNYLEKKTGANVEIGRVNVSFPASLTLKNVFVSEVNSADTLFYSKKMLIQLKSSLNFSPLMVKNIYLKDLKFYLAADSNNNLNIQPLIDAFTDTNSSEDTTALNSLVFANASLKIINGRFKYDLPHKEPQSIENIFDENHIDIGKINMHLAGFKIFGDSLVFDIKHLSVLEKSGLEIKKMLSKTCISNSQMRFEELNLKTNRSFINDKINFSYKSYNDLSDFINKAYINAQLKESIVDFRDLHYFSEGVRNFTDIYSIDAKVNGIISNLKIKRADIKSNDFQYIGDAKMRGLPIWQNTFFDFQIDELNTNVAMIEKYAGKNTLPESFNNLKNFSFNGNYLGFYNDFVAYGQFNTPLGRAITDINLKMKEGQLPQYSGKLELIDFDLKEFNGLSYLGKTSITAKVNGLGLDLETAQADLNGLINYIDLDGYRYRQLNLNGSLAKGKFEGEASLNDSNAKFVFEGKIDLTKDMPEYTFTLDSFDVDLMKLGFIKNPLQIKGKVKSLLMGHDINNLFGHLQFNNIQIYDQNAGYIIKTALLTSEISDDDRDFNLYSDIADISYSGNSPIDKLAQTFSDMIHFIQANENSDYVGASLYEIEISALFKDPNFINHFFQLPLKIGYGNIGLSYHKNDSALSVLGNLEYLSYQDYKLENFRINGHKDSLAAPLFLQINSNSLITDFVSLSPVNLKLNLQDSILGFNFSLAQQNDQDYVHTSGQIYLKNNNDYQLQLDTTFLAYQNLNWLLWTSNDFTFENNKLSIPQLFLENGKQKVFLKGIVEPNNIHLTGNIDSLNMASINRFLPDTTVFLGGLLNGNFVYLDSSDLQNLSSNLFIDNFNYNGDTLGNIYTTTQNKNNPYQIDFKGELQEGMINNLTFSGWVNIKKQQINATAMTQNSDLSFLQNFIKDDISDFSAYLDMRTIRVNGSLENPNIVGQGQLKRVAFKTKYLNTSFSIPTMNMSIDKRQIIVSPAKIYDQQGHEAQLIAKINHHNFNNFELDAQVLNMDTFLLMDIKPSNDEIFYGSGFISGKAALKGALDDLTLTASIATKDGSNFVLPLEEGASSFGDGYISFKPKDDELAKSQERKVYKWAIDIDLDISKPLPISMIFNQAEGEILDGIGTGQLKINTDETGILNVYGNFDISSGSYDFSVLNFWKRSFKIDKNSSIFFVGDPYDARLDLKVYYPQSVSTEPLLGSNATSDGGSSSGTVPVNSVINISGILDQPEISFDIEMQKDVSIVGISSEIENIIESIRQQPEELNKQFLMLLIANTFVPPSFGVQSTENNYAASGLSSSINSSVGNLLASQVSGLISKIDPKIKFKIDYQSISSSERDELKLSLERQLFKGFVLSGSFDAGAPQGTINPYSLNATYDIPKYDNIKLHMYFQQAFDPLSGTNTEYNTGGIGVYFIKEFDYLFRKSEEIKAIPLEGL